MATTLSSMNLNMTPKSVNDLARINQQTPYIPGVTSPAFPYSPAPSTSQMTQALRAPVQQAAPQPAPAPKPAQQPAPAPAPQAPVYDFSQDAFTPQANVSGMTPQQMGQQAQMLSDQAAQERARATAQAQDVARMNNISLDEATQRIIAAQAVQSGSLAIPAGKFFNPATAGQGFTDVNTAQQNYLASQIPTLPNNQQLMQQFRNFGATASDLGDGRSGYGNAGLIPPDRASFAKQEDYDAAVEQYNAFKLEEAQMQANSPQVLQARIREAESLARKEVESMQLQAAEERARVRETNNQSRQRLLESLALRGLTPDTDESARRALLDFDNRAAQAEEAAAALGRVSVAQAMGKASAAAVEKQRQLAADIAAQIKEAIAALQMKKKSEIAEREMTLDEKKAEVDKAYKEGRITLQERDIARKELDSEVSREQKEAQTERTEALTPREVAEKEARTNKLEAETKRIETLTPLEAQRLSAQARKLLSPTSVKTGAKAGTAYTPEEKLAANEVFRITYGTEPSEKQRAAIIDDMRSGAAKETIVSQARTGQTEKSAATRKPDAPADDIDAKIRAIVGL